MGHARGGPNSPETKAAKKRRALELFAISGIKSHACDKPGLPSWVALDRWLAEDPEFRLAWSRAEEAAADALEAEARRRAIEGVRKPKFHQGQMVMVPMEPETWECPQGHQAKKGESALDEKDNGYWACPLCKLPQTRVMVPYMEHEYSDTLAIFLLKGAKPEKYRERVDDRVKIDVIYKGYAGFDPDTSFGKTKDEPIPDKPTEKPTEKPDDVESAG